MRALVIAAAALLALGCSRSEPPVEPEAPVKAAGVVLFLGDSLTAGYGVALEDAFPALLAERWRREGLRLAPRNAGVSGSTSAGVLETLDWTLAEDVRLVVLCVGANDGLRGLELAATGRNLAAIVEKVRARGVPLVLAPMKLPPNYGRDYAGRFEALYAGLARRYGLKSIPFLLEGVAGRPEMNIPDGIHPNASGHRRIAENVHAFLLKEGLLR